MRRLVTTPELRGWTWDVEVGNFSDPESTAAARRLLAANPDVELAAGYSDEILDLDGRQVSLVGLERPAAVDVPVFEGRLPARRGEIALTGATLDEIGKDIGDDVRVSLADVPPQTLRIVGRSLGPGAVRPGGDLRNGGIMVLRDWQTATDSVGAAQTFVVRFGDGVDEDVAARNLRRSFPQAFFEPTVTADVDSFRKTQPLLAVLGVLLAIMAVATLLHAVDSARSRRRRELGVLKALGFGHGQVGASVIVQAVCLAMCGIAVGLPLGLVAGRWAWIASAQAIGVVTTPVVSVLLPVVVLAALGASVLTSLGPARQARRLRTVDALRTE
jgi:putative ABC transport system permease protein